MTRFLYTIPLVMIFDRPSRRRAPFAVAVLCAACSSSITGTAPDRTPVVDEVSPREGPYGTTITVSGRNLAGMQAYGRSPSGEEVEFPLAPNGGSKDAGTGEISFRVAFPAEGEMTLSGGDRELPLGAFTPTWSPGRPLAAAGSRVLAVTAFGTETLVALERDGALVFALFGGAEPREIPVVPAPSAVARVALSGGPPAQAIVVTDGGTLHHVAFDGTAATSSPYQAPVGSVLGIGVDAQGPLVVAQREQTIVRMRDASSALADDGDAIAIPPTTSRVTMQVSGDGTVVYAWGTNVSGGFDDTAKFSMAGLAPGATSWSPTVSIGSLDDVVASLDSSVENGIVQISYCATDTGIGETPEELCGSTLTIDGKSELSLPSSSPVVRFDNGRISYAYCKGDLLAFRAGVTPDQVSAGTSDETALFPCQPDEVVGIATGEGGARLVVDVDGKLYVAHRR